MLGRVPHRLGAGLIIVMLVLAVQTVTAAPAVAATLRVVPGSGLPGSTVRVSGSGFAPLVEVSLCWDNSGCSDLGTANVSLLGNFTRHVVIPLSATEGAHFIHACQLDPLVCASVRLQVEAPTATTTTTTTATTTTATPTTTTTTTMPVTTSTTSSTTTTTAVEATTSTAGSHSAGVAPATTSGSSEASPQQDAPTALTTSASQQAEDAPTATPPTTLSGTDGQAVATRRYVPPTRTSGGTLEEVPEATDVPSAGPSPDPGDPDSESGFAGDGLRFWLSWFLLVVALAGVSLAAVTALARRRTTIG